MPQVNLQKTDLDAILNRMESVDGWFARDEVMDGMGYVRESQVLSLLVLRKR